MGDGGKDRWIERCSTDEQAVDTRHAKQLDRTPFINTATVDHSSFAATAPLGEPLMNRCVNRSNLGRFGPRAGNANSPLGLIGNDDPSKLGGGYGPEQPLELGKDDGDGHGSISPDVFPHAYHG